MFETQGFSVLPHQYRPHQRMGRHRHPEAYICLVTEGGFLDTGLPNAMAADAGSVLLRPRNDEHTTACGEAGASCLKIELRPGWLAEDDLRALFHDRLTLSSAGLALLGQKIDRLMRVYPTQHNGTALKTRLELESTVIDLLAHLVRPSTRGGNGSYDNWLETLRQAIIDDPFRQWTATTLAMRTGRHPVHISRAFRERYGEPVGSFFRRQRLERCRELVANGNVALVDVAAEAGYADQSHFTRAYKQAFGVTPGQEREQVAN
ncbi:MAG TPA: AraC family transcriptional regulator [Gammaproteobacteria bacterium]|nr:AraC family transcriptional regulator [Gammaproteobacteria bacterium]HET7587374.1 AraC family transcriptional regulator [Gammaproteobacteria bacterium]